MSRLKEYRGRIQLFRLIYGKVENESVRQISSEICDYAMIPRILLRSVYVSQVLDLNDKKQ